ncbi:MAG: helix-turn-helix transcriptional regulator [Alphaproteobacteria bacterium]|nr:helix-turn-helix transcriptional regulator [Alphaproteobacteria bacterium]
MAKASRSYGGVALEQRRAERRERLIRAAVSVASRVGREATSVASICAEAGLTARYFYESFPNRDALFAEAYAHVQQELFGRMAPVISSDDPVRSALTGFFAALATHPAPARVFLLDLEEQDKAMKDLGRAAGDRLGQLIVPDAASPLARVGATGAVVQMAKRWIESGFAQPVETLVALALPFCRAAAVQA